MAVRAVALGIGLWLAHLSHRQAVAAGLLGRPAWPTQTDAGHGVAGTDRQRSKGRQQTAEQAQKTPREAEAAGWLPDRAKKDQPERRAGPVAKRKKLAQAPGTGVGSAARGPGCVRDRALREARSRLVALCDILARDDASLTAGQRLAWLRLRTAQVEALLADRERLPVCRCPLRPRHRPPPATIRSACASGGPAARLRPTNCDARWPAWKHAARSYGGASACATKRTASMRTCLPNRPRPAAEQQCWVNGRRWSREAAPLPIPRSVSRRRPLRQPSSVPRRPHSRRPDPSTLDALLRSEGGGDPAPAAGTFNEHAASLSPWPTCFAARHPARQRATELSRQK